MKFITLPQSVRNWVGGISGYLLRKGGVDLDHLSQGVKDILGLIPSEAGINEAIDAKISTATAGLASSSDVSTLQGTVGDHDDRLSTLEAADGAFALFQSMSESQINGLTSTVNAINASDEDQDSAIGNLTTLIGDQANAIADLETALTAAQQVNSDQASALTALQGSPTAYLMTYDAGTSGGNAAIFLPPAGSNINWDRPFRVLVDRVEIELGRDGIRDGNAIQIDTDYVDAGASNRVIVMAYASSAV